MTEQRIHSRLEYTSEVEIVTETNEKHPGRMINLSRGGTMVHMDCALEYGTNVTLSLFLPGIPDRCEIPCIVRWIKAEHGTGLQFRQLRPIEVWALNKLMHTLTD